MKTTFKRAARAFLHSSIFILPFVALAATNDLSGLLQKGLFEEEANRNLDAATAAYQTLVLQFDKDRQIGATAIFRLGEVYRKQGKTNEAAVQYERIVRDFAEQTTLVTLSRQNLVGLNKRSDNLESKTSPKDLEPDLAQLKKLSQAELLQVLPTLVPDQLLTKLLEQQNNTAARYTELSQDRGPNSPEIKKLVALRELLDKQIDERITGILKALELRGSVVENAGGQTKSQKGPVSTATANYDPYAEESEIDRIRSLVQNSPDLINGTPSQNPLITAVGAGWLRVVNFLLDNGANVNAVSGGMTALHQAVRNGNKAIIEVLLKRGAQINTKDGTGGTALHLAAESGFLSIAEVLVKHKADLNSRNSKQNGEQSPLHLAAKNGHAALVGFLMANGDDANSKNGNGETPLHLVAMLGRDGVIERLLKSGANANAADNRGETPLMNASDNGHSVTVKALLAAKANPDLLDKKGRTALSYAVGRGHADVVKALLEAKVDVNAGSAESPLLLAVREDNLVLAETLLRLDANPNQETEADEINTIRLPAGISRSRTGSRRKITPLRASVWEEYPAMTKLLLQFKGDPQAKAYDGSPLFLATLENAVALKAFLEAGADANGKDGKGQCALINAVSSGNSAAVELLLAHGADVNARGEFDMTPLHWAARNGLVKPVELLLASKADLQAKSLGGDTPLHLAVGNGWKQIVEMLLTHGADPNVRNNGGITPLDKTKPLTGPTSYTRPVGAESWTKPSELATLLRQHGALDHLPDFTRIRITRQGLPQPLAVFFKGSKLTNQFTLLESVISFYNNPSVVAHPGQPIRPAYLALPFPDFGRILIRRPALKPGGKEQEITVSLLNASNVVDCTKDVTVEFGDVIEIPERVHALNEASTDPVREMETNFSNAKSRSNTTRMMLNTLGNETSAPVVRALKEEAEAKVGMQRWACLQKSIQLVVNGETASFTVDSWKEGFLSQALAKTEARAALRSSSDLSRVKVTRKDAKSGKPMVLIVDVANILQPGDDLWLRDGDVIEVPDKP